VRLGIFSWLFTKNTESNSHIRKWTAQELEKLEVNDSDVYPLFVELMHTATQWGKAIKPEQEDQFLEVSKQYLGDATIFEVACYTYYHLEKWISKNQSEFKAEIALPINNWIVELFSTTLLLEQERVGELFKGQLDKYRILAGGEKDLEEIYDEFKNCIIMTKGDKFDKKELPKDLSSIALDSKFIKTSFELYEEQYIPKLIGSIEEYCKKNAKEKLQQEGSRELNQEQKDYSFAMALLAHEDYVRACTAFTKVLAANPAHYDSLVQRGLIYFRLDQPEDALRDFSIAIEVHPNYPVAYLHRGRCYHKYYRLKDKSLEDYSEAIRLAPRDVAGYLWRGELYDNIALSEEKQALENNDTAKGAHVSQEFLAAIDDYSQVIALEPEHDVAYVYRGLAYARKARANQDRDFIVKAIADLERAMNLNWEHGYLYKQQDEMKELLESVNSSKGQVNTEITALP